MEYRRLGRTGLNVSILSLGSGGPNRFGQSLYGSGKNIIRLVRQALELGINFFDTASTYGQSESLLGEALQGVPRDRYFVCTKVLPVNRGALISTAETPASGRRADAPSTIVVTRYSGDYVYSLNVCIIGNPIGQ